MFSNSTEAVLEFANYSYEDIYSPFKSKAGETPEEIRWHFLREDLIVLPEVTSALLIAGNVLVVIFAFCGNVAACIVCIRSKFNRIGTRFFLLSLAVSDIIGVAFSTVATISQILTSYNSWSLGEVMCQTSGSVQTFAILTNGCALIAIAIDRYLAVVRGLKAPWLSPPWSTYVTYILMALIWLAPLVLAIPVLFVYEHVSFWVWERIVEEGGNSTSIVSDNVTHYLCSKKMDYLEFDKWYHISIGLMYGALVATLIFSYLSIMSFVRKNLRKFPSPQDASPPASNQKSSRVGTGAAEIPTWTSASTGELRSMGTGRGAALVSGGSSMTMTEKRHIRTGRLLWTLIGVLLVCRLPNWIFLIIITSRNVPWTVTNASIRYVLHLLSDVKSVVNPFLYTIWNDALRSKTSPSHNHNPAFHGDGEEETRGKTCSTCCCFLQYLTCSLGSCWKDCQDYGSTRRYDFTRQTNKILPSSSDVIKSQRFCTTETKIDTNYRTNTVSDYQPSSGIQINNSEASLPFPSSNPSEIKLEST